MSTGIRNDDRNEDFSDASCYASEWLGPDPKFPSREEYLEWCAEQCQKIKTSCIAMNHEGIKEVVAEIDRKLYLTDHQELHT